MFSIYTFHSMSEAEKAISQFIKQYNSKCMLHRLGLKSPIEYREAYETNHLKCNMKPEDNVSGAKVKKILFRDERYRKNNYFCKSI